MKLQFPSLTTAVAGAGLLAGAIFATAQPPATPPPGVDPATHAAHVASGAMPPDTAKADPALAKQIAELQAKMDQLQTKLATGKPPAAAPAPAGPAAAMPMAPAAPPAMGKGMGMGKMKPAVPMPGMGAPGAAAPPMAGMMPMMDKMMGMMDKMMGMGGAAMPPAAPMAAGGAAMPPAAPMMDDDAMEMPPMGGGGAMPAAAPAAPMKGGGMPMMDDDKMEMAGMMGMAAMGGTAPGSLPKSALPGFPGASHLYHIGATGFYLDHPQHITLTIEQQGALNKAKEQALLAKNTADRSVEQAEQELWTLTAADQPDAAAIGTKLAEIGKLRADERLAFIHAVGEASKLLTDDQRKVLTGFAPPAPAAPMVAPAPAAAPMPAAMPDM